MGVAWLLIPALLFLARKPKEAAPAQPSPSEKIAGVSLDVNLVAETMRAGGAPSPLAAGARSMLSASSLLGPATQTPVKDPGAGAPGIGGWRGPR